MAPGESNGHVIDDVTWPIEVLKMIGKGFYPRDAMLALGYRDRNVSVCPSVRLSVRHAPVLCQNEES